MKIQDEVGNISTGMIGWQCDKTVIRSKVKEMFGMESFLQKIMRLLAKGPLELGKLCDILTLGIVLGTDNNWDYTVDLKCWKWIALKDLAMLDKLPR